jgi:hypothetical protein
MLDPDEDLPEENGYTLIPVHLFRNILDREEKVFGRIEMVNEYIRQQIAPPVTDQDKKDCKYCPFTTVCKEVGI